MTGIVYLVGAGPGAPDLLTVRAARLLGEANIVFHDALVHPETLALAPQAEKVLVGKRCGKLSTAQLFINKRLVHAARIHRVVVRLKGGDPMLFGRAHEELSHLVENRIQVEIVPGVTAALAGSAEIGVSLTQRGVARSVTFVTPRIGEGERASGWVAAVLASDTAAIYMGAGEAAAISSALIAAGKSALTPVALVANASLPSAHRRFGTLQELAGLAEGVPGGPALIFIGEVYGESATDVTVDYLLRRKASNQ